MKPPIVQPGPRQAVLRLCYRLAAIAALSHLLFIYASDNVAAPALTLRVGAVLLAVLVTWVGGRAPLLRWLRRGLGADDAGDELTPLAVDTASDRRWRLAGFGMLLCGIVLLEWRQPCFFTRDDNYFYFLPNMLHACRSVFAGSFPAWNPYQLLGMPLASNPQSCYGSLPLYLCYAAANWPAGHAYLTLELYCLAHVVAGYFALYGLLRYLHVRPLLGILGALSFMLSGYVLILGRSWSVTMCVALWIIPLAMLVAALQRGEVNGRWVIGLGLVVGLSYYEGYPQGWLYNLLFFVLAVTLLTATRAIPWRRARLALPGLLLGLALASPMLLPQMLEARHFYDQRVGMYGHGIQRGWLTALLPYPLAQLRVRDGQPQLDAYGPFNWSPAHQPNYMGHFTYAGTLLTGVGLLILLTSAAVLWTRRIVVRNHWYISALVALILACGPAGVLWHIFSYVPLTNKFTGPFKFQGYLVFFSAIAGCIVLERWVRISRHPLRWTWALTVLVTGLLLYQCLLPLPSFNALAATSYPPLPVGMREIIRTTDHAFPQRVASNAPFRDDAPAFPTSMALNFPTVHRILAVSGYDPMVSMTPENLFAAAKLAQHPRDAYRAYGVRWLVRYHGNAPNDGNLSWIDDYPHDVRCVYRDAAREVWELADAAPLAFPDHESRPLPVAVTGAGMDVDLTGVSPGSMVTINVLHRPWLTATVGGQRLPTAPDGWHRLRCGPTVASADMLRIRYTAPWHAGWLAACGIALLALVSWRLLRGNHTPRVAVETPQAAPTDRDG